jgi:hypothetical protein
LLMMAPTLSFLQPMGIPSNPYMVGYPPPLVTMHFSEFSEDYRRGLDALNRESGQRSRSRGTAERSVVASLANTKLTRAQTAAVAVTLAATYPAQSRPEAERVFRELLSKYPTLMQQLDVQPNDLGSSVATFLAGSWMAYRNVDLPDEHFKPLVMQMRQVIGSNSAFAKASDAQKQEMHEQMAILGMFMATTQMALKEKPNPQIAANMKQAAKGYLEQFLKTDAERVQITAQGLVLR